MEHRFKPLSDSSDSQSSDDDIFWKKTPISGQKRRITDAHIAQPKKCVRNTLWLDAARDQALSEALSATHTYENRDKSRGQESYFVWSDSREESDETRSTRLKNRIFLPKLGNAEPLNDIGIDFASPPEEVKETLVRLLNEPNAELLGNVVDAIGVKRSLEFYYLTEAMENAGGIFFADGSRRRSKGGVFLHLIKISDVVSDTEKKEAFRQTRQMKDRIKRHRRLLKKKLEKIMAENKQAGISSIIKQDPDFSADTSNSEKPNKSQNFSPEDIKHDESLSNVSEEREEGELFSTDEEVS